MEINYLEMAEAKRRGQVAHYLRCYGNIDVAETYRDSEIELVHNHNPDLPISYIQRLIDEGYARKHGLYYFENRSLID